MVNRLSFLFKDVLYDPKAKSKLNAMLDNKLINEPVLKNANRPPENTSNVNR